MRTIFAESMGLKGVMQLELLEHSRSNELVPCLGFLQ